MPRHHHGISRWLLLLGLGLIAAGGAVYWDWRTVAPRDALAKATFVGRSTCVECHQQEHDAWVGSHHDRAMELPTDESVRADFNDVTFERMGVTTRFFRDGEKFMVNTEGPDGQVHDYEIKYTFGYEPLQQFMVEFEDGRVQVLRVTWDTEKNEWFYVTPPDVLDERIWPGDPLHWTGIAQNWNTTCAECHSTNLQKNYDLATNTYHTTYSEIDVSCEECHGPGSLHVELANANSLFWDRRHGYGLPRLHSLDNAPQIETCAKCHSHRRNVHEGFRPGRPLYDYYEPSALHAGLYHADGQIQDEVYVYGSFLQSQMFHEKVRCSDCHDPHSLKVKFKGNALCTQCHEPAKYDVTAHHHHKPDTPAASCVECHMPETTYMVVDPRRDHSIRMPRPDLTVSHGTPNSCNGCHTKPEETAQWAADRVVQWYGPKRKDDPHWTPAITAARAGQEGADKLLAEVYHRSTSPKIVKATVVELLARYDTAESRRVIRKALKAYDPQIRLAGVRAFQPSASFGLVDAFTERLNDPVRAIRVETARRMIAVPPDQMADSVRQAREEALKEYRVVQEMHADRAAGHINLGELALETENYEEAAASFRHAMRLEPYLAGPRRYLAQVLTRTDGDQDEIMRLYKEEIPLLKRDTELAPANPIFWFELGRLQVITGQTAKAVVAFTRACQIAPTDYRFRLMHVLALERLYESSHEKAHYVATLKSLKILESLDPSSQATKGILQRLQATRAAVE